MNLSLPFTKEERTSAWTVNYFHHLLADSFFYYTSGKKEFKGIVHESKRKGDNRGQYGYFASDSAGPLYCLIKRMRKNSFCDLGCGPGVLGSAIHAYDYDIKVLGYEIEPSMTKYCHLALQGNAATKNILHLEKGDIAEWDVLYFWEPLKEESLAEELVKNLEKIVREGHIIIYKCSGMIGKYLDRSKIIRNWNIRNNEQCPTRKNRIFGLELYHV